MKLLILCEAAESPHEHGLRAALAEQFRQHRAVITWLTPGQVLTAEFADADEPVLVVDCLGARGNPFVPWVADELFAELLGHCRERDWIWLMLSDSSVFSATQKRRYVENDLPLPSSDSARQLLARENFIADSLDRYLILRVGPVIASSGENLLTQVLPQLRAGVLPAVDAQRFCPTPAHDIARVIGAMHDQLDCGAGCWGTYHYESSDPATRYEFAEVVLAAAAQYWPLQPQIESLPSSGTELAALIYPPLNCQRIRDTFGVQQLPWRRAIPSLLKEIHATHSSEISS